MWMVLARSLGFLTRYRLRRARLTARGQVRCRWAGSFFRVISAWMVGRASSQSSGRNARHPDGGTPDDAQGMVETDAIGVDVGGFDAAGDEYGDGVVDGEPGPDLLVDQVGQAGAQHPHWTAQVGLDLVVAGLVLSCGSGALLRRSP